MINESKQIVENYINNRKPACLMIGTAVEGGIKVSEKLTIPGELVYGNLKDGLQAGDQVRLLRNDGGQAYYILEVIGAAPATKGRTLQIEPITVSNGMTISSIAIKDVVS